MSTTPTAPAPRRGLARGPLPVLGAALLWGTTGTAASFAPAGAHPAAIGSAGLAVGGLLLLFTGRGYPALLHGADRRTRGALALGALAVAGYPLAFYPAVAQAGVAVATVITLGSAPVFAGLLAWLSEGVRPGCRWSAATLAAVAGCTLLVLGAEGGDGARTVDTSGVLLALAAGASYALYAVVSAAQIRRGHPSGAVMGVLFAGGGLVTAPVVLALDPVWLATGRGAAVALYLALFTVFLAYTLFGVGLRHTPAATATTLSLAEPAVAALLGVSVVGERLSPAAWTGMAVLALGLAVLRTPSGRRPGRTRRNHRTEAGTRAPPAPRAGADTPPPGHPPATPPPQGARSGSALAASPGIAGHPSYSQLG
ncbi:DMT family transporter [Nocardiopsis sp. CNT312]|uniref:DMT family transporter n=1 Tax=Nocardiopsis sp. CNT312 TaxID=1137268 RepID=UPI0004B8A747|nr:EamA family transporter [Nocardiopsis sp. CNT312]